MEIIVNTQKSIKLESSSGLTDVVITIFDSSQNQVVSQTMSEILTGVYEYVFTPIATGNYTAKIESVSLSKSTHLDIECVVNEHYIMNENIKDASLVVPADRNLD